MNNLLKHAFFIKPQRALRLRREYKVAIAMKKLCVLCDTIASFAVMF